jgi:hypothetical protein
MKKYRRVEITAFERRVTIVSGEYEAFAAENDDIRPAKESRLETIAPESDEGRRLLAEAVSLLQESLAVKLLR